MIADCGTPTAPENGNVSLIEGNTKYQAVATQECDLGYTISGSANIECLASASWSAGPVTCTIKGTYNVLRRIYKVSEEAILSMSPSEKRLYP